MYRLIYPFILLVLITKTSLLVADQVAVENLSKQLTGTETIAANFKQTIRDIKGNTLQEAVGTLLVKRPNKLHWLTQQPYEHLVVTNGKQLWLYDIDLEQVNQESYADNIDKAPALLLSGNVEAIVKNYTVEQLAGDVEKQTFSLSPKSTDSAFTRLEIQFSNLQISNMTLLDNFDQITTIEFSNLQTNQPLSDQQFEFVAPEGVEVISNDR